MLQLLWWTVLGSFLVGAPPAPEHPVIPLEETAFCASDLLLDRQRAHNPDLARRHDALDEAWGAAADGNTARGGRMPDYVLPVVVHIIHAYGSENIADAVVEQGVQDLNDAFANLGVYDPSTGVDTKIQFCLAGQDPEGGSTTGITRTASTLTEMTLETQDLELKDIIRWDPTRYINIWVVREICSVSAGCGVAGYAYFPSSHGQPEDGIVLEAEFFGSTPQNSAILAHEMGHYLGLYHTFEGGCANDNCLQDGDQVCDTPPDQSTVAVPCGVEINSCFTDVNPLDPNNPFASDQLDLINDYMDYGDPACFNMFTQGQADRMSFFIDNARSSLLQENLCDDPCPNPISVFVIPGDTIVTVGSTLEFLNLSQGATTYEWRIAGNLESTAQDFTYTFNDEGLIEVELILSNGDSLCTVSYDIQIQVISCFGNAYVSDAAGTDATGCGSPGNPCQTIQYALDNIVCPGDTVFIYSGQYSLPASEPPLTPIARIPQGYSVTFLGLLDNGPVVIDGNNQRRGFQYDYSSSGCPDSGADDGIDSDVALNFFHLTLQNCQVIAYNCGTTNVARGGGIQLLNNPGSSLTVRVEDCSFFDNFLDDPVFLNNSGRSVAGAGIYVFGAVTNNTASNTSATVTIDRCSFNNNVCQQQDNGGHGAGIYLQNCSEASITRSYFCENRVYSEQADAGDLFQDRNGGGAVHILDTYTGNPGHPFLIDDCFFVNNTALTANGATFPNQSEGGAVFLHRGDNQQASSTAILTIGNSQFYSNLIETGVEHVDNSAGTIDLISVGNNVFEDDFSVNLANDTTVCDSVLIGVLDAVPGGDYVWSNGASGPTLLVTSSGLYGVTLTLGNCSVSDAIQVTMNLCQEICDNGIDDDGDGLIDCCDPDLYDDPCCADHPVLNLGPDTLLICDNGTVELVADSGFVSYEWQDGWTEPTYTVWWPGTYWVTVEDSVCGLFTDTIVVQEDPATIARVEPSFALICPGQSVSYTVEPEFDTYLWLPGDYLDCDDCPDPVATPDEPVTYIFIGGFANGCYSVDTVSIAFDQFFSSDTVIACPGETVEIFGEIVNLPGNYAQTFTSFEGCDSIHTITLVNYPAPVIESAGSPSCVNVANGIATVNVLDGTPPYSYAWANFPDTGPSVDGVLPGVYTVTVTDGNGCETIVNITVEEASPPVILTTTPEKCEGLCDGTLTIENLSGFPLNYFIEGIGPFTDATVTDLCAGTYVLEIEDALGCVYNPSFTIDAPPPLFIDLPASVTLFQGDTIQLNATVSTIPAQIQWQPTQGLSCTDCLDPLAFPEETTQYALNIVDINGCEVSATVDVRVLVRCEVDEVEVPNIFTPNGDGMNDSFRPILRDGGTLALERLEIYNRWGQLVYETNDPEPAWDGRQNGAEAPSDVYVYLLRVACPEEEAVLSGEVTLLR